MEKIQNTTPQTAVFNPSTVPSFFQLMKPRVMSLVIFTGFVGMYLAPDDLHPVLAIISLIAIAAGAGASGAINQWYDRDIDAIMHRTRSRPIPSGEVAPSEALAFGIDHGAYRGNHKIGTNGGDFTIFENYGTVFNNLSVANMGRSTDYGYLFGLRRSWGLLSV